MSAKETREARQRCGYVQRAGVCRNCQHLEIEPSRIELDPQHPKGGKCIGARFFCALNSFTTRTTATCRDHEFREKTVTTEQGDKQ